MGDLKCICELLKSSKNIAVIGLSDNPMRTSFDIAHLLLRNGFNVVGVNPLISKSGEIVVYPNLTSVPFKIDIVNVFRRSEFIPDIVNDVIQVNPKALWLQQGIRNDNAVKPVQEKGITVLQDICIAVYYNLCKAYN
jgi:predicted CoA-binding protein